MRWMGFRFESINGQIVDSNELYSLLHQQLGSFRFEINEVFVKFSVLPVFGILRLEKDALHSVPVEPREFLASDGAYVGYVKHRHFSGQRFERKFVEPLP